MSRLRDDDPSAVLLRQVKAPPPLSPAQVERIAERLGALPPVPVRRGGLALGLGLALTAALLTGVWLGRWGVRPAVPRTGELLAAGETVRGHGPGGREWLVLGPGRFAYDGNGALAIDAGRLVARGGAGGLRVRLARGAVDVPAGATVEVEVHEAWFRVAAYAGRVRVAPAGAAPVDLAARQGLRCEGATCGAPRPVPANDDLDALLAPTASAAPASTPAAPASASTPAAAAPRTAFASTHAVPSTPSHRAGGAVATPDDLRAPGAAPSAPAYEPPAPSADTSPGASPPGASPSAAPSSAAASSAVPPSSPTLPPELPPAALPSPSASPGGALADESQRLEDALHALRQRHDPARALAATRAYRERFPGGVLAGEADRIDLEALLALGRSGDALALVERMPAGDRELRVWRAELRAAAGRCAAALPDFAAVLAAPPSAAVAERALYGQAGCRARLGDRAGADRDLAAYLARFPDGRHADEVRRARARR